MHAFATWRYANPVKVVFGNGSLDLIGTLVDNRAYCLVTYGDEYFAKLTARIADLAGPPAVIIDDVTPNPHFAALRLSCHTFATASRSPEVVVALGGGSAIDTGKVLAAAAGNFSRIRRFLETGLGKEEFAPIPIIAIPTTAGTGSEVTRFATVWDREAQKKYSLALDEIYAEYALVDPTLALAAPRELTVSTGLDALSHALESIWNVNANPVSTNFSIFAASEVLDALPALASDLNNLVLRTRMARAATIAGLAMSNTQTALAHTLSYPFTLKNGIPHGIACSFSLPLVMRWAIGATPECDRALKRIFGPDLKAGVDRLAELLLSLGVSMSPTEYGMRDEEWKALIQDAFTGELGKNFLYRKEATDVLEDQHLDDHLDHELDHRLGHELTKGE